MATTDRLSGETTQLDVSSGETNVGSLERTVSVLAGSAITLHGLRSGGVGGMLLALAGGAVIKRGVTGHCEVYGSLGVSTADPDAASQGSPSVDVSSAATVRKDAQELYRFWRDASNLPRFMTLLEGVEVVSDRRARWKIGAPLGRTLEFEAEITADVEGERIAWRAVEGAMIEHDGEVSFQAAPGDRGTEVRLRLQFRPPLGAVGAAVGSLFDGAAEMKLRGDLKRFKQLVETGEIATTDGQPSGRA
jgi:uncharacterized membrane protein